MKKTILLFLVLFCLTSLLQAQLGGNNTYEFLNLSASGRISALGGNLISVRDDDVSLAYHNPALLNPSMHRQMTFSHSFHMAGISHGYAAYAHHVDSWKTTLQGGVQYVSYGDFEERDEFGNQIGSFKAAEYAVTIGGAYTFYDRLTLGANVKAISSQLAGYNSFGVSADLGAMYFDTSSQVNIALVFRNVGTQISSFRPDNREPLPFDVQLGVSKKLRYLPFRLSIIYHNLHRWNVLFDDPNAEEPALFFGDVQTERSEASKFVDNLFRHFIFNGELLIGKRENFRLRLGYNHFMRKELSVDNFNSLSGFSYGFGLKINRFRIDFGRGTFHLAGGLNQFSISTNLREFGI